VLVTVEDNGRGMPTEPAPGAGRLGLVGMRERVALVGGTLEVESIEGAGTALFIRIPLSPAAPETEGATS
jgi:chemotaxis family two-component system sensor kinase Cph1